MKTSRFLAPVVAAATLAAAPAASALTLLLDYTHDTFFSTNPTAKAALEAAAADIGSVIVSTLTAINPGQQTVTGTDGSTTATFNWSFDYTDPSGSGTITRSDTSIAADSFMIYVGMKPLTGSTLGQGGIGGAGLSLSGSGFPSQWIGAVADAESQSNTIYGRGGGPVMYNFAGTPALGGTEASYSIDIGPSIGNLWFDIDTDNDTIPDNSAALDSFWHFDHTTAVAPGKNDFYSVALHEILHSLGVGGSLSWNDLVSGTTWNGSEVVALFGGGEGLIDPDGDHIATGVTSPRLSDGEIQEAAMSPTLITGQRKELTTADLAFLRDIGWETVQIPEPGTATLVGLSAVALLLRRSRRIRGNC